MPRVTRIRTEALETLAAQLRYAPSRTVLRQIESIEAFAGELDPDTLYPEDFVVYRVTGYRPPMDEPSMIVGGALLADLSALAERISAGGRLSLEEHAQGTLSIGELTERWNVSRKTLDRARRRGLIARRVRRGDGKEVLAFSSSVVDRYEAQHADALGDAAAFARVDSETESRIANAYGERAQCGSTPTTIAHELAEEYGISHETVRRIVRSRTIGANDPLSIDEIERGDALGEPIAELAARFDRTPASIRRILRARRIERLPMPTEQAAPPRATTPTLVIRPVPLALTQTLFAQQARSDGPTNADHERALAAAYRSARRDSSSFHAGDERAADLDMCETALRRAFWAKRELLRVSRRLVLRAIEERAGAPFERLPASIAKRAHASGVAALARAADRFEPSKGGRLAAGASLELARALAHITQIETDHTEQDGPLTDWSAALVPAQAMLLPSEVIEGARRAQGPLRELVERRYGLVDGLPRSLDALAIETGLSRLAVSRRVREAVLAVARIA